MEGAIRNVPRIKIHMLGSFMLREGEAVVSDDSCRARQVWNLLEYMVTFRNRDISQSELIDALWEDDGSENPSNALKNLIYRIRTIVAGCGLPSAKDLIVFRNKVYSLNPEFEYHVDVEEFEELCKHASNPEITDTERIDLYQRACQLYKGDFLLKSSYEKWVVPLSTFYHNLYIQSTVELVSLLSKNGRDGEIPDICRRAINIDQYEERLHLALIRSFIRMGRQDMAMAHYEYVTNLFYTELGVKPSESLRNIYREIIKNVNHVETDLEIIKEDLREISETSGAFCCEYEVFKNMYRLEARAASRSGQAVYLALLTLTDEKDRLLDVKELAGAMDRLLQTIRGSLRRGDVVSRFSANQYVLMLPTMTLENGQMVLKRIVSRYKRERRNSRICVHTKLQPLDPAD